MSTRISEKFSQLKKENQAAFVGYIMGGDPDYERALALLKAMPDAGVDIIELGFPFTDPAADGPVVEDAGLRALRAGTTLQTIFDMVREFRKTDATTPIIVMGYANPVHHMGYENFARLAGEVGIDGAIIVDLPPEEDGALRTHFQTHDLALIRLATPTTDDARLSNVVANTRGFVYYVSVTGITGKALGENASVEHAVTRVRKASQLPVVVGFGVKTKTHAQDIAKYADGVVVGSAIVDCFAKHGQDATLELIKNLATATHNARD